MNALTILGGAAAAMTMPGTIELLVLSAAGALPGRTLPAATQPRGLRLAVIVPAHNEEVGIGTCVRNLLAADRGNVDLSVVVVADNCTDRTAEVAAAATARVLIRENAVDRGKGYALDFAFQILLPEGYDAFLIVDADSSVANNFIRAMAAAFASGVDAAQCRYMIGNSSASIRARLMSVANYGFNVLRPRGRDRLGLSCHLYGNGFGVSADTLRAVPHGASSLVEDLEYHLQLVRAGRRVRFVDLTTVWADAPVAGRGVGTQRVRWEGGRLRMIAAYAPKLLLEALKGRLRLLEPCLDLLLLPLAFHVPLLLIALLTPVFAVRVIAGIGLATVFFHMFAAIRTGGGGMRDVAALAAVPFYVGWKLLLLPKLIISARSGASWVRTERAQEKTP